MYKFLSFSLLITTVFSSNLMAKKDHEDMDPSYKFTRQLRQVAVDDSKEKYVLEPRYIEIIPLDESNYITVQSDRFSYYCYHSDKDGKKVDKYGQKANGKRGNFKGTISRDIKPAMSLEKLDKLYVKMHPGQKRIKIQKNLKIAKHALKLEVDKTDTTNTENPPSKLWWK